VVTPAWDTERAAEACPAAHVTGADELVEGIVLQLAGPDLARKSIGLSGMRFLPSVDRRPHHRRAAVHDLSRQACIRRRPP